MQGRHNHLPFIILALIITALWFGCTQPDDVIAPISETELIFSPERLPTLPDSLTYYIWAIDTANEPNAYLIGNFVWKNELYKFYDLDSNVIDSIWSINYDILDPFYQFVAISIEKMGDLPSDTIMPVDSIGPIMLQDTIRDPAESPIKMTFPMDLWIGTGFFCMETPTDGNSDSLEASGIWFAEYVYDEIKYADTFDVNFRFVPGRDTISREIVVDLISSDTSYWNCTAIQFGNCVDSEEVAIEDTADGYDFRYIEVFEADSSVLIYTEGPESPPDTVGIEVLATTLDTVQITRKQPIVDSNYTLVDTLVLDSFIHHRVEFEFVTLPVNITGSAIDTAVTLYRLNADSSDFEAYDSTFRIYPLVDYNHELVYGSNVDSQFILVDKFLHSFEEVPDLIGTGWHYKGWAISPYLTPKASFGSLNKPSWNEFYVQQELSPNDAGIITTGSFKSFRAADNGNPYSDNKRVPPVPGEDFILNLPTGVDSIVFADSITTGFEGVGTVMITLEPDNYENDMKNFPLVYFTSKIPSFYAVSDTLEHTQFQVGDPTFNLSNKFSAIDGSSVGFPSMHLKIIRR